MRADQTAANGISARRGALFSCAVLMILGGALCVPAPSGAAEASPDAGAMDHDGVTDQDAGQTEAIEAEPTKNGDGDEGVVDQASPPDRQAPPQPPQGGPASDEGGAPVTSSSADASLGETGEGAEDPALTVDLYSDEPIMIPAADELVRFRDFERTRDDSEGPSKGDDMEQLVVEGSQSDFERAMTESMRLNRFFSDPQRFEEEVRVNRLRLRTDGFWRSGFGTDFDFNLRGRFVLPKTDNRLVLLLSGDFDRALGSEDNPLQADIKSLLEPEDDREDGVLAIQGFLAATERFNISVQAGGRLRGGDPIAFIGPRYRQTFAIDKWAARVLLQSRWFTDEGFALRGFVDFERSFNKRFFLRVTPRADWSEEDDGIFYGVDVDLAQRFSSAAVLRYQVGIQTATEPRHEITQVTLRLNYRRQVWRDWLFLEFAPEVSFPSDQDYEITPGFFLRADIVLGSFSINM